MKRRIDEAPIPYEDRLSRWARRRNEIRLMDAKLAEIALDTGDDLPTHPAQTKTTATLPGDPIRLRGIPAVGGRGNAGGHIRGTRPDQQI